MTTILEGGIILAKTTVKEEMKIPIKSDIFKTFGSINI
jgi:hypothetical protein